MIGQARGMSGRLVFQAFTIVAITVSVSLHNYQEERDERCRPPPAPTAFRNFACIYSHLCTRMRKEWKEAKKRLVEDARREATLTAVSREQRASE